MLLTHDPAWIENEKICKEVQYYREILTSVDEIYFKDDDINKNGTEVRVTNESGTSVIYSSMRQASDCIGVRVKDIVRLANTQGIDARGNYFELLI